MSIRIRRNHISIIWSVFATATVFLAGFAVWLVWAFRVQGSYTGGIHVKHWTLGIWAFAVGIIEFFITGFRVSFSLRVPRAGQYGINFRYIVFPYLSSIIYFALAATLVLTELADFRVFLSCPTSYDWISPTATCLG